MSFNTNFKEIEVNLRNFTQKFYAKAYTNSKKIPFRVFLDSDLSNWLKKKFNIFITCYP